MSEPDKFFELVGTAPRANKVRNEDAPTPCEATVCGSDSNHVATGSRRSWAESDSVFWGVQKTSPTLPCGIYRMDLHPQMGAIFMRQKNDTDTLVQLPDCESQKIISEIEEFKTLQPAFRKHGFLYKRGILMWGPPGSGKTSTLQQIIKLLIEEHDSIAVLVERPGTAATCLQALRNIEPERQIVAIMEDVDALTERYGESEYLALMDGESQVDNIVFLATTNYPERLDKRFTDRPSRFDTVRYVGMPSAAARRSYLRAKVPDMPDDVLSRLVGKSDGFSIAHLRELIILTQCFSRPADEALERLGKTIKSNLSSTRKPDAPAFGFGLAAAQETNGSMT